MITYHNKTEYYTNLADRPGAPTYGVGSCFVGAVEYLSDGATWAAAATVDTGAGALLTGFSASAGAVAATDSILIGFNKVVANVALRALNLITGYISGAGVIAATDTVLQAIQKLDGNIALKQTTMNVATADYYVAVTSEGVATTKLTFVNGLLTQVTPPTP